jgi:hypothetical protein
MAPVSDDVVTSEAVDLPEQDAELMEAEPEPVEAVAPPAPRIAAGHDRELFFAFKGRPRFSLFGRRT